jgi:competence protein ComEA
MLKIGLPVLLLLGLCAPPLARAETVRQLEGVVNINTASPDELRLLSGVGPAKIRNILAYRRARAFRTVEEFARVKGIGRKMVRRLRMHLAVAGPTTAQFVIRPVADPDAVSGPAPAPPAPPAPSRIPAPRPPTPVSKPHGGPPAKPGGAGPRPAPGARQPLPWVIFPEAGANHCTRPR